MESELGRNEIGYHNRMRSIGNTNCVKWRKAKWKGKSRRRNVNKDGYKH